MLLSCALVLISVASFVVLATVFGRSSEGGTAFVTVDPETGLPNAEHRDQQLIAIAATTEAPPETTTTTTTPPSTTTTSTTVAPTTAPVTTVVITDDPGLHDIPPIPAPVSFEVLDQWRDGPSRSTIWASSDPGSDRAALEATVLEFLGPWVAVESGQHGDNSWARMIHASHPWCLYVEVYDVGPERRDDADDAGLTGAQFFVVETPYCDIEPGAFG